ncbi:MULTISPECIES: serine/threonine-protein kinase [Thermomonosporaceae]|uniref:serine/threonine-protein kinase n=1 Tax=Thermomonosporaceae TaxID=2012 RepID=UPI00255A9AA8|nr:MULTISPECIES: serine/threonine-protein kinase [Thermomonosporaceae]MDL4775922.1 protein kinase [Actinomadura xylanilytica]
MADGEQTGQGDGRLLAGRYRLLTVVGSGGMGTVWRARDEMLDREVAVKEVVLHRALSDDERETRHLRTLREARASARLNHPGVVTVHDVVDEDDRPWIVMELVQARSLQEILDEDGPQRPGRVATIGRQVVAALRAAHAIGILHRDVKPANVLIAADDRAVLTDFGIAQMAGDATLTHAGLLVGSPAYMSPERVRGDKATPSSDLWALGATLYAACEGKAPHHRSDPMAVLAAAMTQEPPPPRNAGPLAPVLMGLLDRDPVQRMGAARAEEALAGLAAGHAAGLATGATTADPYAGAGTSSAWTAPPAEPVTAVVPDLTANAPTGTHHNESSPHTQSPQSPMPYTHPGSPYPAMPDGGVRPAKRLPLVPVLAGVLVTAALVAGIAVALWPDGASGDGAGGATSPPVRSTVTKTSSAAPADRKTTAPSADVLPPVPPGSHRVKASGYTIAVPDGWTRTEQARSTVWIDPRTKAYVQVDRTPWTGEPSDPLQHWINWEKNAVADGNMQGFRRLSVTRSTAGRFRAADIEFVWDRNGGTRARDRGVYIDQGRAYAVLVAVPATEWSQYTTTVKNVLDTFRPTSVR